jgi:hypothetical protein
MIFVFTIEYRPALGHTLVLCLEKGMWKTLKENGEIENKSILD